MTYQAGTNPPVPDALARREQLRQQLGTEIAARQSWIASAEVEVGRVVSAEIRAGRSAAAVAEIDGELRRIVASEYAIAELQLQAYAIDAEAAAEAAALAAVDPSSRCPACRASVLPHQRYCAVCGTKLTRAAGDPAAPATYSGHPECARCGRPIDPGAGYCSGCGWRVGRSQVPWYRARWLRFGLVGFVLYAFCQAMLPHTHNAVALIIAELIIGAALVPLTFVGYFYERGTQDQTPLPVLAITFLAGAILGCTAAVILETSVKISGNWGDIGVGFIEEGCKAAIVLLWLRRRDLRAPDRGLVIGAATGMGFAALETMQYGLQAFLSTLINGGSVAQQLTAMSAELNVRGVLAPLGHGTWTGILAAVIWFERSAGRSPLGARVWVTYVGVSLLHGLYDIAADSHTGLVTLVSGAKVSIFVILIGLFGFVSLLGIARASRNGRKPDCGRFRRLVAQDRHAGAAAEVAAMSFIDRALNAATDAAKSSASSYQRSQRRRAVEEQIFAHQQTIQWATARIGRLAMDAGSQLPPAALPAAEAARRWEAELAQLHQQVAQLDGQPPPGHGITP